MITVDGIKSRFAALLVSKNEIDPIVEILRHIVGLERLPKRAHKQARIIGRPGGQDNIVDGVAVLSQAELEALLVGEKLVQEVELGYELLVVGGRLGAREQPRRVHGVKCAIGHVKVLVLIVEEHFGERRQAN